MRFKAQSDRLKIIMIGETYLSIFERTGIKKTRMSNLLAGKVELTLGEAYKLNQMAGNIDLFSIYFLQEHTGTTKPPFPVP